MKLRIFFILFWIGVIYVILFKTAAGREARPQLIKELPQITKRVTKFPTIINEVQPSPTPQPVTPENFLATLNNFRKDNKLPLLKNDTALCPLTDILLQETAITQAAVQRVCPLCTNVYSLMFESGVGTESALLQIKESSVSGVVKNSGARSICIRNLNNLTGVVMAKIASPPTPKPIRVITDDELWQALTVYREAQKRTRLERDERLCQYAKKRVNDHLKMEAEHKPKDQYPVPLKYPLDAHDGFTKDADSGYVFEVTGRSVVAENLAYWPNAEYGVHVIEWGWDTSTEGHREAQLSNDFTVGCLAGKDGYFVAIFGR